MLPMIVYAPQIQMCIGTQNVYIFVGIENPQITFNLKYWHSCAHRLISNSGSIWSEIEIRNYGIACKTLILGFQFISYLWNSKYLQVTFANSTCYTLTATTCNKLKFLCSFVIVFLCQQKCSYSFS